MSQFGSAAKLFYYNETQKQKLTSLAYICTPFPLPIELFIVRKIFQLLTPWKQIIDEIMYFTYWT